jgi:hypothetical protein
MKETDIGTDDSIVFSGLVISKSFMSPLRGWAAFWFLHPGRCPGLQYFAPSGLIGIPYTATLKLVWFLADADTDFWRSFIS